MNKLKVNDPHLKRCLFLYIKGHLSNGLTLGQIDDMLKIVVYEVSQLFLKTKAETSYDHRPKEDYPYVFNEGGEQIGGKVEDYE